MPHRAGDGARPDSPVDSKRRPALVVGLGASAGGIGALNTFFSHAPPHAPFAYVVILHLSPDHDSKLADVLQAAATIPVTQVRDTVSLESRRVYVIPPNQSLEVAAGDLRLSPMTRFEERRAPVDTFFRTLADEYGSRAAAVVLSGTGPNGSSGLKRVKERGGLTVAQDPGDAQYGDMPANAIATGLVDFVLPAAEIPSRISAYFERLQAREAELSVERAAPDEAAALRDIMSLVRARTTHDFANYKPATVWRRIARRMSLHGSATVSDYARLMRAQPDEAVLLMKELLISVTEFFRDPEQFGALERDVIPALFDGKTALDQVRLWSAGCATGEEAYSLAMLAADHAATVDDPPVVQVLASDLDEQAVAIAREGLYSDADVADIAPERLRRFFQRESGGYRVRRELREMVLFARHNVIKDPPFSHLDLIACRNVMIYLNRTAQDRLLHTFHFALRPGGFLVLGTSEAADGASDRFVQFGTSAHIYASRAPAGRAPALVLDQRPGAIAAVPSADERAPALRLFPADLHLRLLEQFAPPSLIVNEEHTVVHVSENGGRFLQLRGGEPSRDLMRLVHPALRADLRTALLMAAQQRSPVELRGARVPDGDGTTAVRIAVKPVLRQGDPPRGYFVVQFDEEPPAPPSPDTTVLHSLDSPQFAGLDGEIARIKSQLQITIDQYEAQAEARQAANEELQAMNEELRSAAEELETSKEELQSVNEELSTVNQELKVKIEELRLTNDDLQNLINSTEIGAVFLDRGLRIKLATSRAREVFNLLPADVGRRLSDITSELKYPELSDDVAAVVAHLRAIEREVPTRDGRWFYLNIVPYRTIEDRIDGVAITFHDVTRRRSAEGLARVGEQRLRLLIDSAIDYAIFTMTADGRIDYWNPGAERMFGYRSEEILGRECAMLFTPEDRAAGVPQEELQEAARTGRAEDERWHVRQDGERFWASGVTTRLGTAAELGYAKIARDMTDQRRAETALRTIREELEDRVRTRTAELGAEVAQHAAAREDVTALLHRVVSAQEDERGRIARDLHDQLGQQLTALRMSLERHADQCQEPAADDVRRALALTRQIDTQLDFLAWELRPAVLDDLGITAALPRFLDEWSSHYGIAAHFAAAGNPGQILSRDAESAIYRVAQEALNNVAKHAHASRVDVVLERGDEAVVLVVEDDGVGFNVEDQAVLQRGIGLAGMRERAALIGATLHVESQPGATTVFLRCPIGTRPAGTAA